MPDGPGIGVAFDADRVARDAEGYEREAEAFAFHDPGAMSAMPSMPKG